MTVYKYTLEVTDYQTLTLPLGAKVLSVAEQRGEIVLYALVDPRVTTKAARGVWVVGTGHPADHVAGQRFLGTVSLEGGELMFHVFVEK